MFTFLGFSAHIDNPLKNSIAPKILKVNISRIKSLDDILVSLVRTRYTNLNEYKLKIREGIDLPSYIRTLLNENNYWTNLIKEEAKLNEDVNIKHYHNKKNSSLVSLSIHNESSCESNASSMQNSFEQQKVDVNSFDQSKQFLNENVLQTLTDEKYTNFIQSCKF